MRLAQLDLDALTPAALWSELDPETKALAARALYADSSGRRDADLAVAAALRFRDAAVRKLSLEQRVGYLLRAVKPTDALASSLLIALHLGHRRPLLSTFLSRLGVPQQDGVIEEHYELPPLPPERLREPIDELFSRFPETEVALYLMTLTVMDPGSWSGVARVLRERRGE